jgi:hypothetical protein
MGDLSNFERGQTVCARLAGASVIKTATLLGVSRKTVSKVMLVHKNHGNLVIRQLETHVCYGQVSHPSRCSLHQEELTLRNTQGSL